MKFGDCTSCGTYKYLEENHKCPSCREKNWVVFFSVPHTACSPEVIERGLSKEEAEERAEESYALTAVHEDSL